MAECPNCGYSVPLDAKRCGNCPAAFTPGWGWTPIPGPGETAPVRSTIPEPSSEPIVAESPPAESDVQGEPVALNLRSLATMVVQASLAATLAAVATGLALPIVCVVLMLSFVPGLVQLGYGILVLPLMILGLPLNRPDPILRTTELNTTTSAMMWAAFAFACVFLVTMRRLLRQSRDPRIHVCHQCGTRVPRYAASCPACGELRPGDGWPVPSDTATRT